MFSCGDTKLKKKFSWRGIGERIYRTEHCEGPIDEQCIWPSRKKNPADFFGKINHLRKKPKVRQLVVRADHASAGDPNRAFQVVVDDRRGTRCKGGILQEQSRRTTKMKGERYDENKNT